MLNQTAEAIKLVNENFTTLLRTRMTHLSDYKFTLNTFTLLNKGFNFCPTSKYYDKEQLSNNFKQIFRIRKLRAHFGISDFQTDIIHILDNKKSKWTPINSDPTVDTFIAESQKKLPCDKVTQGERQALASLQNNKNIVITRADKGAAIVIWGMQEYINEAQKHLSKTPFYKQLDFDPSEDYAKILLNSLMI